MKLELLGTLETDIGRLPRDDSDSGTRDDATAELRRDARDPLPRRERLRDARDLRLPTLAPSPPAPLLPVASVLLAIAAPRTLLDLLPAPGAPADVGGATVAPTSEVSVVPTAAVLRLVLPRGRRTRGLRAARAGLGLRPGRVGRRRGGRAGTRSWCMIVVPGGPRSPPTTSACSSTWLCPGYTILRYGCLLGRAESMPLRWNQDGVSTDTALGPSRCVSAGGTFRGLCVMYSHGMAARRGGSSTCNEQWQRRELTARASFTTRAQ